MWELRVINLWIDGKHNPKLDDALNEGFEPFGSVTSTSGGGSFLGGMVDSQPMILFRRIKQEVK